jgi:hypothetical protein
MGAPIGNHNASRGTRFRNEIEKVFARLDANVDAGTTLNALMTNYVMEALAGDKDVRKDLLDRMFGKPPQGVTIDGDGEGGAVVLKAMIELIKPSA